MEHDVFVTDEDREETVIERRAREQSALNSSGKAENEEFIPLIPNVKADQRKTIIHLEVWKVNPPGDGFKGKVTPTATAEHIAKLYGDGVYDIKAITAEGKTLRQNPGLKVSWVNPDGNEKPTTLPTVDKEMSLLSWQASQHEKDSARTESFGKMIVDTVTSTAKVQLEAQAKAHEMQISRDREMYSGILSQSQTWAQSMMDRQAQSHRESMERSEQNFRHAMQLTQQSHERQLQSSNPNAHLQIFQSAMQWMGSMGLIAGGPEEEEDTETPWVKAIEAAGEAISDITDAYKVKTKVAAANGAPKSLTPPQPQPNLTEAPPNGEASPAKKKKRKGPGVFTREDVMALAEMKAELEKKGIPFSQAVRYARQNLMGMGANENGVSEPGDSGGDSQESNEESGNPDVGDG